MYTWGDLPLTFEGWTTWEYPYIPVFKMDLVSEDYNLNYNEEFIEIGRLGDFSREIEWSHFARFQQLSIKVRLSDPIRCVFFSAAVDVREAGV